MSIRHGLMGLWCGKAGLPGDESSLSEIDAQVSDFIFCPPLLLPPVFRPANSSLVVLSTTPRRSQSPKGTIRTLTRWITDCPHMRHPRNLQYLFVASLLHMRWFCFCFVFSLLTFHKLERDYYLLVLDLEAQKSNCCPSNSVCTKDNNASCYHGGIKWSRQQRIQTGLTFK